MNVKIGVAVLLALAASAPSGLSAHSGGTDGAGCHQVRATGEYHCHDGKLAEVRVAQQLEAYRQQRLRAETMAKVTRPTQAEMLEAAANGNGPIPLRRLRSRAPVCVAAEEAADELRDAARDLEACASQYDFDEDCSIQALEIQSAQADYEDAASEAVESEACD